MSTDIDITVEIDDGDDVEGCYVVATAKGKDPHGLWKVIQHIPEWEPGNQVVVRGEIIEDTWRGTIHLVDPTAGDEAVSEPVKRFAARIYHPRLQLGSIYTEYDGKTIVWSRMLLKRADEDNVFYVGVVSSSAKSELETIFQGPRLTMGLMKNQDWLEWIRPLPCQGHLIMRDGKTHSWQGWRDGANVGPIEATAEKGYEHPGSAIELPDLGGTIHLQYGHPDQVGRNGCFTTDVIQGLIDNLSVYEQLGHPMSCQQTKDTLYHLERAKMTIEGRRADRQSRDVHQTDKP